MLVKGQMSNQGNVSNQHYRYTKINSTKSPASGAGNDSQPNLMSQVGAVRMVRRVSAVRAVEVPVFVGLRSSCSHVTETEDRKVCDTRGCNPVISRITYWLP